jgi:hypothetical protein
MTTTTITEIEQTLNSLIDFAKRCQENFEEKSKDHEYWRATINTCEVIQLRINAERQ